MVQYSYIGSHFFKTLRDFDLPKGLPSRSDCHFIQIVVQGCHIVHTLERHHGWLYRESSFGSHSDSRKSLRECHAREALHPFEGGRRWSWMTVSVKPTFSWWQMRIRKTLVEKRNKESNWSNHSNGRCLCKMMETFVEYLEKKRQVEIPCWREEWCVVGRKEEDGGRRGLYSQRCLKRRHMNASAGDC